MLAGACLRGSGIAPKLLREPAAEIEAHQELAVVRNIVRHLGHEPGLGLVAGSRYQLTAYGIWGYFFLGHAAQPNHVLHEQVEATLSEIAQMYGGRRGAAVSAVIVSVDGQTG